MQKILTLGTVLSLALIFLAGCAREKPRRAEALIEKGDLNGEALQIINDIRSRAKRDISGTSLIKYAKDQCDIALYGSFASKDDARKALRWERLLHTQ
jgi:hypothetical protein